MEGGRARAEGVDTGKGGRALVGVGAAVAAAAGGVGGGGGGWGRVLESEEGCTNVIFN